ncbi:MAG: TRAP transporter substrate-binding protein DctP [Clostridiales Family XIII bacterium]|nr:TRAP transporter substrate-binding protein DctP [Clostridiales Family XIII bacterium]
MKGTRLKWLMLAMAAALALSMAACGGGSVEAPADTAAETGEEVPAAGPADDGGPQIADIDVVSTAAKTVELADIQIDMPTPTIAAVPAGAEGKTWDLTLNDQGNDAMPLGLNERDACAAIGLRTNGQVKITPYFNNTLLEQNNQFPGVVQGIADISLYTVNMNPGAQPAHTVFNIPASVVMPSNANLTLLIRKYIESNPAFAQENEERGVVGIGYFTNPPNTWHSTGGDIKSPADIKGKKVIGNSMYKAFLDAMGGSIVALGPGEWYTSLEKGVADTQITHWPVIRDFNLLDVYKSHTLLGGSTAGINAMGMLYIVNKGVWDTIPSEYQDIIKEELEWVGYATSQYNDAVRDAVIADAKAAGQTVIELTPEEAQAFFEIAKSSVPVWAADAATQGVEDPQGLYDGWMKTIEEGL